MIHNDHLGTPQKMTDSSGVVVWAADYKPFGEATVNPSSTITNNLRFPGQYYDAETGLNYNYFRDYNLTIGRYVEADPLGLQGGLSLYSYVGNKPTKFKDPKGLEITVTVWQPVGWGPSSFGHVSTDINGTTYSFGPNGMTVMSTSDYLNRNAFREGVGLTLNLTLEQERRLYACMSKSQGSYSFPINSCGVPVQNCLNELQLLFGTDVIPAGLGNDLIDSGLVKGYIFYPATKPATGSNAPWAK